jgi:hypothetical protein
MPRFYILKALIYKELLRYRYNWGLLVLVFAVVLLSGLVSIGARMDNPLQTQDSSVNKCYVLHPRGSDWAAFLRRDPPKGVEFATEERRAVDLLAENTLVIELIPPKGESSQSDEEAVWTVKNWTHEPTPPGVAVYRDWFVRESRRFLDSRPRLEEISETVTSSESSSRVPVIVTALAVFALYLISFNLYITSTGEEREKRLLLAVLLTPATPTEMILAKAIFYSLSSLFVTMLVVAIYDPALVANPQLWRTVVYGSASYVAIGTVAVSIVRRQTTINTVSMLYLIGATIVMALSTMLLPFAILRFFLIEHYLYRQFNDLIAGSPIWWVREAVLAAGTACWLFVAILVFGRFGGSISRAR